jgi:hypothetical protein
MIMMAKTKTEETVQEENIQPAEILYNAKALVYIKYDKNAYKPEEEFQVRESDLEELKANGYVKVLRKVQYEEAQGGEDE